MENPGWNPFWYCSPFWYFWDTRRQDSRNPGQLEYQGTGWLRILFIAFFLCASKILLNETCCACARKEDENVEYDNYLDYFALRNMNIQLF
jgi:hypothetical protein